MDQAVDHVHMECVWCGMLWKEVIIPKASSAGSDSIKNHCPRCGGVGARTEPRT